MLKINKGLLVALLGVMPLLANAANNDEWWEYSMQVDGLEGMAMPAQKDCYRKNDVAPTGGEDCTSSNVKQKGSKYSSDYTCKDGSSGHIEGSQTASTSDFKLTGKSPQGEITKVNMKGKKIGSCNWETDSIEAKACAQMNQSVASSKADIKKQCEKSLKDDDFGAFLGGENFNTSVNMAGKKCGGSMATGCPEQRPQMCSKVKDYLKDITGNANGFKKVMSKGNPGGADLAKQCGHDPVAANKQFCSERLKIAKGRGDYQDDIVQYCESDAKALFAQHCAGRDYTAQHNTGYGNICDAYGKGGSASSNGGGRNYTSSSSSGSSSGSDSTKGTTNPVDGVAKGAKKLKDLFGF